MDFPKLLRKVDDGFRSWRKPTVCLFGSSDPFVDAASVFEFLESKRTNSESIEEEVSCAVWGMEEHQSCTGVRAILDLAKGAHGCVERVRSG